MVTLSLLACISAQPNEKDFDKLSWLIGNWNRVNVREGRSASERWERVSENEFRGWGVSMRGQDTTFLEKLKLLTRNDTLFYVADVAENPEPVYFKITSLSPDGFVCENQAHDFPKKIQYMLKGDTLTATTSGDGKEMNFIFVREAN